MFRCGLSAMVTSDYVKRCPVTWPVQVIDGTQCIHLAVDRKLFRLLGVDSSPHRCNLVSSAISEIRSNRDRAFIAGVEERLGHKIIVGKTRWNKGKLYVGTLQVAKTLSKIAMPGEGGVEDNINVVLDIPGSPLLVEYTSNLFEYLQKVSNVSDEGTDVDGCSKPSKEPSEVSKCIKGVSESKYAGASLRCRRRDRSQCYIKYGNDDEYAAAVTKARRFMEGEGGEKEGAIEVEDGDQSDEDVDGDQLASDTQGENSLPCNADTLAYDTQGEEIPDTQKDDAGSGDEVQVDSYAQWEDTIVTRAVSSQDECAV